MLKKFLSVVISASFMIASTVSFSANTSENDNSTGWGDVVYTCDDYDYELRGSSSIALVAYRGHDYKEVEIPYELDGYTVTELGKRVFEYTPIESVIIPNTIELINTFAFAGCSSIQKITLPDSVTSIESFAFSDCYNLKSIYIPESVQSISSFAFLRDDGLIIYGENNSYAHSYALSNGIKFRLDKSDVVGDVNGDGLLTISDVTVIQKHLADISKIDDRYIENADVNGDGEITILDVTDIQKDLADIRKLSAITF